MNKIIALGPSEFILGFRLAGIQTHEIQSAKEDFDALFADSSLGIIITDETTMQQLPLFFREAVEARVKPVTVVVSADATSNETLRKKIKKSIGVDLWSK